MTVKAPNIPNLQALQTQVAAKQSPEDIYKILYNGGMVQGEPGSKDRIRIKVDALDDAQKQKLKEYMPTLGYEFYRTKNDGRLVFRKSNTETEGGEEQQDEV